MQMGGITLPHDWYTLVIPAGVERRDPGIYEWRIEGVGVYIGKFTRIGRPTRQYGRNVRNLLNRLPYRKSKPDGFRRIHRELEAAHRQGIAVTLTILENVAECDLDRRERELISERGSLNVPPFGGKLQSGSPTAETHSIHAPREK